MIEWSDVDLAVHRQYSPLVAVGHLHRQVHVVPTLPDRSDTTVGGRKWLVVPYSLALNDARFWRGYYATGDDFYQSAKETFERLALVLVREAKGGELTLADEEVEHRLKKHKLRLKDEINMILARQTELAVR